MSPTKRKKALITGVTGQDGSYLSELLLEKGYEVKGVLRRSSSPNTSRIDHLYTNSNFSTSYGDLTDPVSLINLLDNFKPDEIYNLASMSHVGISFEMPVYALQTNTLGLLHLLEYVRQYDPKIKLYQASSSEMFGVPRTPPPFDEHSDFRPKSPYGVSKLAAFHLARNYREAYGIFASTGILFNHESPRRGENFVTRKITLGISDILSGKIDKLKMGNIESVRDWGHAKDYVRAVHLIMQQKKAGEYVVATGEAHSIKEALEFCFDLVGLNWRKYVVVNKKYLRPNDIPYLQGDSSKIRSLGWKPEYDWKRTLQEMLEFDMKDKNNENNKKRK